jgi:hypothetical protein
MNKKQGLFIFLLLIINLISCATTEEVPIYQQDSTDLLNYKRVAELESILKSEASSSYGGALSLLRSDILADIFGMENSIDDLSYQKGSYEIAERMINRFGNKMKEHKAKIHNFKSIIENTEIFLKSNPDDTISKALSSFRENLKKYEDIINGYEERFKASQYKFELLKDQYLADKRKEDARRKSYKEHILKGIDDIGINSEYFFSNESTIGIIESLYYFQKKIYLTVRLIILPHSHANIDHFHLYDKFTGHLGSPEDKSDSWLYSSRDEGEPRVYTYKRVFSAENIPNNGELKLILQGSNVNYEKTLKYTELDYSKTIPTSNINDFSKKDVKEKDFVSEITKIQGKRKGDHILIPGHLDIHGKEIDTELLLDTGASVTTISYDLYKKGNSINLNDLKRKKFQTANGIVMAYIDQLKLKTSAYTKEIEVAIINNDVSLLGANYFEGNVYTIDLTNECIYIHPKYAHK